MGYKLNPQTGKWEETSIFGTTLPNNKAKFDLDTAKLNNIKAQTKLSKASLGDMKWNKYLKGAGVGIAALNLGMNLKTFNARKKALEKQNQLADENIADLKDRRTQRQKKRKSWNKAWGQEEVKL